MDNRDLLRALDYFEAAGYSRPEVTVYLMIGLSGQTPEEAEKDIRFVNSLGAAVSLAAYSPIPRTPDYLALVRTGVIEKDLDPLWQNNSIFCLRRKIFSLSAIRGLRELAGALNRNLPGPGMDGNLSRAEPSQARDKKDLRDRKDGRGPALPPQR